MAEDCLNLNIWSPAATDEPLPVLVYIHGGGWSYGSNSQETSDLSALAQTGKVIGVSINYRLGALGWLSLAQYGGQFKDASNLGLQDILVALEWVQHNIARFGGNPHQVTLVGHSAGAYNALALLGINRSQGLFQRIAAFSGFPSRYVPQWFAEELAHQTLKKLDLENLEELLTIDPQKILQATASCLMKDPVKVHGLDNQNLGMVADWDCPNGLFDAHPMSVLASGSRKDVAILMSSTTYEVGWYEQYLPQLFNIGGQAELLDELVQYYRIPRSQAEKIVDFHTKKGLSDMEIRALVYTSFSFSLPATRACLAHAQAGGLAFQLNIGSAENALAVHGTELYGIIGKEEPKASSEQHYRDEFVTQAVIDFSSGHYDRLWEPVGQGLNIKDIGQRPYQSETHFTKLLQLFEGLVRT